LNSPGTTIFIRDFPAARQYEVNIRGFPDFPQPIRGRRTATGASGARTMVEGRTSHTRGHGRRPKAVFADDSFAVAEARNEP